MKKKITMLLIITLLLILSITPALAGGDQVRGDNGQGPVWQEQIQDPPPFQP